MTYTRKELVDDAKAQILAFMQSDIPNAWVRCLVGEIYFRNRAVHILNETDRIAYQTFDVANIEILPQYRGKAIMHELLEWINTAHSCDYTYIQCIQNEGFAASLLDHGWIQAHRSEEGEAIHVYRPRATFDPTVLTYEVTETDSIDPRTPFSGRVLEIPNIMIFEATEAATRRELFRLVEHFTAEST
jgi:hypothetical protein